MDIINKNIVLVGDFILDHYIMGSIKGFENTSSSLILNKEKEYTLLGGAANVALHLSKFIPGKIDFYFKINNALSIQSLTSEHDKFINFNPIEYSNFSELPIKHRYICSETGHQLLRMDEELIIYQRSKTEHILNLQNANLIMISDYNKGTIDDNLMQQIINSNITHIIDGKVENHYLFKWAKILFPNDKEYIEFCKESSLIDKIPFIVHKCGKDGVIVEGWNQSGNKSIRYHIPIHECFKNKLVDSCGCGDIIFAITAILLPNNFNDLTIEYLTKCVDIAMYCASYAAVKRERIIINKDIIEEAVKYIEDHT